VTDISIPINGYKNWLINLNKRLFIVYFSKKTTKVRKKTARRRVVRRYKNSRFLVRMT
jgi:secreted Zn-dependent insulinase-like peptidase